MCLAIQPPLAAAEVPGVTVGDEVVLAAGGDTVRGEVAVAHGSGGYLAVWRDGWHGEGGNARIHGVRLDAAGKPVGGRPAALAPAAAGIQERPRVAFARQPADGPEGGVFIVVWQQLVDEAQYDILAVRVSAEGKSLDARPIVVATGADNQVLPTVASDGRGFVVAWQGAVEADGNTDFRIFSVPVSAAGAVGQATRHFIGHTPLIAWDGTSYMILGSGRLGVRLDAAGKPLGGREPAILGWVSLFGAVCSFAAGGDGGWMGLHDNGEPNYWGWGGQGGIECMGITADGQPDPEQVAYAKTRKEGEVRLWDDWLDHCKNPPPADGLWPSGASAVCWDGTQFVAVWQRHHMDQGVMFQETDLAASRVQGWRPQDRPAAVVAGSNASEQCPAVASDGAGKLLCLYEKLATDGNVAVCARPLGTRPFTQRQ